VNDDVLLGRFLREVYALGAQACCPDSLNDEWLEVLFGQSTDAINHAYHARLTELVGVVTLVLEHHDGVIVGDTVFTDDEVAEGIERYRYALTLEIAHRAKRRWTKPATFEGALLSTLSEVSLPRK